MLASVTPPAANSLLLHVCCGPCSIMPVQRLQEAGYAVTAWFMNPNIQPLSEYFRRREAAGECAERLGIPILYEDALFDVLPNQSPIAFSLPHPIPSRPIRAPGGLGA